MSEQPSGKPITLTRREALLGGIGAAGVAITAGIAVNDNIEEKRRNDAVASKINAFKNDALEESRIKQQTVKKAEPPTPVPNSPVTKVKDVEQVEEPKKPFTRIGYFREGFNPNDLAEFCRMVKEQEDILDIPGKPNNVGISTEKIKNYFERFGPMVNKVFPLASQAAGRGVFINSDHDIELKDLFHCLILAESIGDPNAESDIGAIGLTQVMPIGAMDSLLIVGRKWQREPDVYGALWDLVKKSNPVTSNIVNPRDFDPKKIRVADFKRQNMINPEVNIALGSVQFLALMDRFDENIGMAISAYNAGSGKIKSAVDKYWQLEGDSQIRLANKPNFIQVFKRRKELGLEDENNENWVYLPRILAIYRKIHGPHVFPLAA